MTVADSPVPLDVVILTRDEEKNLPACLASLAPLGAPVHVVDSGSTDRTLEIATAAGCRVVTHPFSTHAEQWSWALENVPLSAEWVLGLDADQRLTPALASELRERFEAGIPGDLDGFYVKRRQVFRGRWIRHGGYYPKYLLKLFRRRATSISSRDLVDHHFGVAGRTERLRGDVIEENLKEEEILFWLQKHLGYADRQAREELSASPARLPWRSLVGRPDDRTAWLKQAWRGAPLYVRPFLYFGFRYVLQLGFLDGRQGLVFHFLQALWYRFVVDVRIEELRANRDGLETSR